MMIRLSTKRLSQGTQGPDAAQVHRALASLGKTVAASEREQRVYGPTSVDAILALQQELGVPTTGVVDEATVKVINGQLGTRNAAERGVRGLVRLATGAPATLTSLVVRVWHSDRGQERLLGESPLDPDGAFDVRYVLNAPAQKRSHIDLRVEVANRDDGYSLQTRPDGRAILQNADLFEVVNFVIDEPDQQPRSEYEQLDGDLRQLLEDPNRLDRMGSEHVHLLAEEASYPIGHVAAYVTARRLASEAKIPPPLFYALVRGGLPGDLGGLLAASPTVRTAALEQAVNEKLVPERLEDGRPVADHLKDLPRLAVERAAVPPREGTSSLRDLARTVLTDAETHDFLGKYTDAAGNVDAFWSSVAQHPKAGAFRQVVELGGLTNNHLPLVKMLQARPMRDVSELASLPIAQWNQLLAESGTPPDTPGATEEERATNYRKAVLDRVERAFFRPFFATRLREAGAPAAIAQFINREKDFDPRTTHVERFLETHPGATLDPRDKEELKAYQRVLRLAGNAADTIALKEHVHSAQQVVAMGPQTLTQKVPALGDARAREIFARAQRTNAAALALWSEHASALNRTGMAALPRLDAKAVLDAAVGDEQQPGPIPDWETLFGSFDLCACDECNSVHGPAAYFVDVLQFLDARGVLDKLLDRRPDLTEIELSCANSNTVLPYVDLVNEILEDQVARPEPFTQQTLAGVTDADFAGPLATEALRNAFTPPLRAAASVETLEEGVSWRVLDEAFAYHVTQDAGAFKSVTRSRQTTGSTEERRAYPQYRNNQAYEALNDAFFPWTLPFDRNAREASIFLRHLGVSRGDVIERLRAPAGPLDVTSPLAVRLAAERLGITDRERRVLVGELASNRTDYWSEATIDNVQDLLEGSGLQFGQLDRALSTWFVDPKGSLRIEPPLSCDTEALTVVGFDDESLSRLHRFVRLWRALGWTIEEVDKVLRALAPDASSPAITNELLMAVADVSTLRQALKLPVLEVLALWRPIDTDGEDSLYLRLFQDEKFSKSVRESLRLRPDGQELSDVTQSLTGHSATLQAVLRLSAASLSQYVALTDGALNLANLGFLLRRARLTQATGLSPDDLIAAIALSGIDPFESSQATRAFVETVTAVKTAGFRWTELDYLLRHRFLPPAPFVPSDEIMASTLTELRAGLLQMDSDAAATDRSDLLIDRITTALDVPEALTSSLLVGTPEMDTLLAIRDVSATDAISRTNAEPQFVVLQKLLKIALVVNRLKLPGNQWQRLTGPGAWVDLREMPSGATDVSPLAFETWFRLIRFQQLRRYLAVEDGALDAVLSAQNAVAAAATDAAQAAAKTAFIATLEEWLGWRTTDIESLIGSGDATTAVGLLGARVPEDYRSPELLTRLAAAIRTLKSLGVDAAQASLWCEDAVTADDARAIRSAAMARHDEKTWLQVAKPLQDPLRNAQRAALVDYLVARPAVWQPSGPTGRVDANDLFAHYLIDVDMDACQLTSRLKQAMGSVQLFAQRCLIGLEGVPVDDEKWLQWRWMKNFRVWEANRKVWLYPENWIEPELRDDKTPFFKDLESELLQGEVTDAAAEKAVVRYLEKLDQVGRLEICGTYEDDETHVLHVFGRTFNTPHVFFYRCARIVDGTPRQFVDWCPWKPVELDIEGDHLLPVVRNRKLMLLWPLFSEKQTPAPIRMPDSGGVMQSAESYWDIQLAWSEYQGGQWTAKNVSKATPLRAYQGSDDVLFGKATRGITDNTDTGHIVFLCHDPNHEGCPPPLDESNGEEPPPPTSGSSGTSTTGTGAPAQPPLVDKRLFSFKAFASGDSVIVRGYLSLGYAATPDPEVSAAFGEFVLSGCRNIVTSRPRSAIPTRTLPLAPKNTQFDYMWFAGSGGLRLFDGNLPFHQDRLSGIVSQGNTRSPLFDGLPTVASMKANKIDIEVFRRTPTKYRLLAPHQDVHFKGDRPFFFMDDERTLMVTSTGSSGQTVRPDLTQWTVGDLATVWTAEYFGGAPSVDVPSTTPQPEPRSFVILQRGADGRRTARQVAPLDLHPTVAATRAIPQFWTTRRYHVVPFQHPFTCDFLTILDRDQLRGLLSLGTQERTRAIFDDYDPIPERVQEGPAPIDEVDFRYDGSYETYNWELFFHIPLLVADQLTKNQRFEEALRWYHFVFDPTGSAGGTAPQRYWRTLPFNRRLQQGPGNDSYEAQAVINIEKALAGGLPSDWLAAVDEWRANPFNPHAVARLRTTAYQKTVVMKYIDNLIAWGDQLFRRETLESLNEATQLYVLAAEILGRRPEVVTRRHARRVETFESLRADSSLGPLSNAEQLVPEVGAGDSADGTSDTPEPPSAASLYFCVPENDKLLGYWDTVADRLFKLRHCMDIAGRVRQLPLFEPPIDPALLVRAQAAGLTISDILDTIGAPPSNYRFTVMLQKANELTAETRNLGAALLSALEKRDAEALALLRSRQETTLLAAVRDTRQKQVDEAKEQVAALQESRRMAETRLRFFESREFQNPQESTSLELSDASLGLSKKSAVYRYLAGKLAAIGALKIGAPPTAGLEVGPDYLARSLEADAGALDALAYRKNVESQRSGRMGDFTRRQDEWNLQIELAGIELEQLDRQQIGAEIRLAIAERELQNHDLQTENARDVDRFMRDKFTNADLFSWMVGQTSALYFQSYQLAFDTARQAERCLAFELGEPDGAASYIRFGYWDSLKKGLLAGERLAHDLRRLELAHLEKNVRDYELTKHVSLAALDPLAFITLKDTGRCERLTIPESLFDLDTPGHYLRRLKQVSVTIPCVTGPYTGVHCKLRLLNNEIRWDPTAPATAEEYPRNLSGDLRFVVDRRVLEAITTSTAQNDSGLHELSFRDERYLPFEGAGAVSTWSLELPTDFRSFDYNTISDVILHLHYTAREGGDALKAKAIEATKALFTKGLLFEGATASDHRPLARLVSLRHEFPSEWHRFASRTGAGPHSITVDIAQTRFPYFVQGREITITTATVTVRAKPGVTSVVDITPGQNPPPGPSNPFEGQSSPGFWTLSTTSPPNMIEDVFVILEYSAG